MIVYNIWPGAEIYISSGSGGRFQTMSARAILSAKDSLPDILHDAEIPVKKSA